MYHIHFSMVFYTLKIVYQVLKAVLLELCFNHFEGSIVYHWALNVCSAHGNCCTVLQCGVCVWFQSLIWLKGKMALHRPLKQVHTLEQTQHALLSPTVKSFIFVYFIFFGHLISCIVRVGQSTHLRSKWNTYFFESTNSSVHEHVQCH